MRFWSPITAWLEGRTPRERRLLLIMALLALGIAIWVLLVAPAMSWRAAAAQERDMAERRLTAVLAALETQPPARASTTGNVGQMAQSAATAAGLEATFDMGADGGLGFRVANAPPGRVLTWLSGLQSGAGACVASLSIVENADATVNVEGEFATSGGCA